MGESCWGCGAASPPRTPHQTQVFKQTGYNSGTTYAVGRVGRRSPPRNTFRAHLWRQSRQRWVGRKVIGGRRPSHPHYNGNCVSPMIVLSKNLGGEIRQGSLHPTSRIIRGFLDSVLRFVRYAVHGILALIRWDWRNIDGTGYSGAHEGERTGAPAQPAARAVAAATGHAGAAPLAAGWGAAGPGAQQRRGAGLSAAAGPGTWAVARAAGLHAAQSFRAHAGRPVRPDGDR